MGRYAAFPGGEILERGLRDLKEGVVSVESLLVEIGLPRLRMAGIRIPKLRASRIPAERRLYRLLCREEGDGAHSAYNAWIGRLVSLERALESEQGQAQEGRASSRRAPRT